MIGPEADHALPAPEGFRLFTLVPGIDAYTGEAGDLIRSERGEWFAFKVNHHLATATSGPFPSMEAALAWFDS